MLHRGQLPSRFWVDPCCIVFLPSRWFGKCNTAHEREGVWVVSGAMPLDNEDVYHMMSLRGTFPRPSIARSTSLIFHCEERVPDLSLRGASNKAILPLRKFLRTCRARDDITKVRLLHFQFVVTKKDAHTALLGCRFKPASVPLLRRIFFR
jgi:hypothetical protein